MYREGKVRSTPGGEKLSLKPCAYKQSELYEETQSDGVPFVE